MMHTRLRELSDHLDRHRAELRAAVEGVPAERHGIAPADGAWSVLGVLEHLAIVENRVGAALQRQVDAARAAGVGQENDESPIIPVVDIPAFTDRRTKVKASAQAQPQSGKSLDQLWGELDAARETVRAVIRSADGMRLTEVTMPHPVFGSMHLYQWFAWLGSHEARHAAQIREIGARLAVAPS
jgi:uncharacterized damage-inducible protein DinB